MPTTDFTNGHGPKTAVLYARVSTKEQARNGNSLGQQLEALRAYAAQEGLTVINAFDDPGYSGEYLERPGLDRVRDLVEAGGVGVVLAQDADRITREPQHRILLDEDFARHGCVLKALDDWGDDTHEGQLLKYLKGWQAKGEKLKTAERTRRGRLRKARQGKMVAGPKINYGFRYNAARDGYEVDEETMPLIRRVFYMVGVEGRTMHNVQRVFEAEDIPAPGGGRDWSRSFFRDVINDEHGDVYKPHTYEEVAALVAPDVAARLDPGKSYGLRYYNKKATKETKMVKTPDGYKRRSKHYLRPRSEWIAVPVPDAGIPHEWVEAARKRIADNYRPKSNARRVYELAGGLVRCAECGRYMVGRCIRPPYFYYICTRKMRGGSVDPCSNRKHRAEQLEQQVTDFVGGLLKDPRKLIRHLDEQIERQRGGLVRGDADREAERWAARLVELDHERDGYIRHAVKGRITDADLDGYLEELDDLAATARRELEAARNEQGRIAQLQADRDALAAGGPSSEDLANLAPEERREAYKRLGLVVGVHADGDIEMAFSYGLDMPADAGLRPGTIAAKTPGADKAEAARKRYEVAVGLFKADCERDGVDPKTYRDAVEQGDVPQRYFEAARRQSRMPTYNASCSAPRSSSTPA